MDVVPIVDEGLGNSSYLVRVGDDRALVVDPSRDPVPSLAAAERLGVRIDWVAETHLHADFVTGSLELVARGATLLAPAAAALEHPHRGLSHGDEVQIGDLTLRALATPGHTPEHLSYVLHDRDRRSVVFSGGALLAGSVARTDLITPEQTEPLARALWRSIHEQLLPLPDDTPVYPTHGGGSFCSAPAGDERTTTIGRERANNPLLAAGDEDAFVRRLADSLGSYPGYFLRLREVNRRGPRVYGDAWPVLAPLNAADVERFRANGGVVVDARPIERFADGHIPGALSIELRPAFASWLGWLVDPDRPLVFVLDPEQDRADLVRQCLTIGYEQLAGELAGGMDTWRAAMLPEERVPLVTADDLDDTTVVDVRQTAEYRAGHIPGSLNAELGTLTEQRDLPDGPLTVMCAHGHRAMTGASLLARAGHTDIRVLREGTDGWSRRTGREPARTG